MTALTIACRHVDTNGWPCGAQPGERCNIILVSGRKVAVVYPHAERIEDVAVMTANADSVSVDEFDKAVEESGIV